ncbi:MAG: enoyl-CoA hydratase/isomerase family protein [Bacteroidetes bacterium]|nr:MAG: enoyl-CoA hydratase/isomerase family protein [Bacteroidota bacterium]
MVLEGKVELETAGGIATIRFSHPAQNSLPGRLLRELAAAIREAGAQEAIRVVVLCSGGDRTFCAGASFDELAAIETEESGLAFFSGFALVINAIRTCPKFVIGRVQGKAVGGGVGLAAATDYCLATPQAAVKLSELNVGIGPFVVGPAVERKMGLSAFSQLAIDASTFYPAEWARQKGLYNELFEDIAALDAGVAVLAERLCAYSPEAMRELKRVFWQGTEHWDTLLSERAAISGRLVLSTFTKEAIAQFKEKR